MTDIRIKLAERLKGEMERKGFETTLLAERSQLPGKVVSEYLGGVREPRFEELNLLCRALGSDLLWLLSAGYKPSKLIYRKVGRQAMERASAIENSFSLVSEAVPKSARPAVQPVPESERDALMILLELNQRVSSLRERCPTVEALYRTHRLPVLGLSAGDEFDGFLMGLGKKSLVCVNTDRPNVRLEFSLLHEFAHFAFDVDRDLPVDVLITPADFYRNSVSADVRPEYIANKFAQQFLVPMDTASDWLKAGSPEEAAAKFVQSGGVSPETAANALYDVLWMNGKKQNYAPLRDAIQGLVAHYEGRREVREFVSSSTNGLHQSLGALKEGFDESRWHQVCEAWGVLDAG